MRRLLVALVIVIECLSTVKSSCGPGPPSYAITINLPAFRLYLYRDGELLHDYPVAIGKPGTPTPDGDFRLVCKVRDPVWYPEGKEPVPPGPENPLGRWWLGLSAAGYGIHGCLDESSIGKAVSNGCIRLHNRDLAQLVQYVDVGVPVRIVYQLFALREDAETGRLWLWSGSDIYRRGGGPAGALSFLAEKATMSWERDATSALLAGGLIPGWLEVPRPVLVFCRDQPVGRAYQRDGRIWFDRRVARLLPGAASLAETGPEVGLDELALLTAETVDWRYSPADLVVTAYPSRLRRGEAVREGAVRVVQGRVMLDARALAALAGESAAALEGAMAAPPGEEAAGAWVPLAALSAEGWRLRWSAEEWEVVAET